MGKRKRRRPGRQRPPRDPQLHQGAIARVERVVPASQISTTKRRVALLGLAIIAAAGLGLGFLIWARQSPAPTPGAVAKPAAALASVSAPQYVGQAVCVSCHAQQAEAWHGSHHDLAMQEANTRTVLGDFGDVEFQYAGVTSRFFTRDGKFMVRTDGPDGQLTDFEISYTFGVTPLQQYLIQFPGGRYQALSIAWDSRPQAEGGQRWFHLYPNERIDHTDPLHWTGRYQNWNMQCAACHSTNLRKGYDTMADEYNTTFSDINVACETCHGPGSQHVEWAQQTAGSYLVDDAKGLPVRLQSRWKDAWRFPTGDATYAVRDRPAAGALMNVCAACHARRSTIAAEGSPGAPLEDTHRPALLTPPLYYADGQQHGEVYTWGSFVQSKMHQHGVTCMDCHEPHALKLRAPRNTLCARCHNAAAFDTEKHHFHPDGSPGAQCVECHMPAQAYMVIDSRRDHSLRVPRPDMSLTLGSPNACTMCHTDRQPEWAAARMDQWYGTSWRHRPHYGPTLYAGTTQGAKPVVALLDLARSPGNPAIVRATAATLAQPHMRPEFLPVARLLLKDSDPSVRMAGLALLERFDTAARVPGVVPLLTDPIRAVRIEAARVVADVPDSQIPASQHTARERALQEYVDALQQDADWPAAHVALGNLYLRRGRAAEAISAYERALKLDAHFAGAYANLADTYRQQGRESEGEQALRRGLSLLPRAADLHHALGLLLVRQGDKAAAVLELATAAGLAPDNPRYAYVYAIGLHSTGRPSQAIAVLRAADARHPYDLDILSALIAMYRETGDVQAALNYARKVAEALPDDPAVKRLVTDLEGTK
jgi:tetratricopeptide (TPR) repeat protein